MLLYLIVRYLRATVTELPDFVRFHLTDLLFVPAMSLFALIFVRYIKRDINLTIPFYYVLVQVIIISIYFEWYLPNFSVNLDWYTPDLMDIVMYSLGGVIFLILQTRLKLDV